MPLTFINKQGQEEEFKRKPRPAAPRFVTSPSGKRVRVPQRDEIGNVSLRPAGFENIIPTQTGLDLPSFKPAAQQLSELAQDVDAAQAPLPPGTTLADLAPPGATPEQQPLGKTWEQYRIENKQATNRRHQAAGQPLPYPEVGLQGQTPAQQGQQLMNAPVRGVADGIQIPADKFGQRLFYADYAAQLQLNKARNLADDKTFEGRRRVIADLDSFGDFKYLGLDKETTTQLKRMADAGKKSNFPGSAYARIVDLIKAKRAEIQDAEQEQKKAEETARKDAKDDEKAKVATKKAEETARKDARDKLVLYITLTEKSIKSIMDRLKDEHEGDTPGLKAAIKASAELTQENTDLVTARNRLREMLFPTVAPTATDAGATPTTQPAAEQPQPPQEGATAQPPQDGATTQPETPDTSFGGVSNLIKNRNGTWRVEYNRRDDKGSHEDSKQFKTYGEAAEWIRKRIATGQTEMFPEDMPQSGEQPASEPAPVTSQADFDALPSGSVFIGPDGKKRRKP